MRYILTGGIASGKSTVVSILKENGINVIDADEIAHQIFSQKEDQIREMFGLSSTNTQLRKEVGEIVFNDKKQLKQLEELLHPQIQQEIKNQEKLMNGKHYILDIPLYFETRAKKEEDDFVTVVYTTPEIQLERLMERNGFTEEQALARINSQKSNNEKFLLADYKIPNNAEISDLKTKVYGLVDLIKGNVK